MASYPSDTSSGFSTVSPSAGRELPPWHRRRGASGPAARKAGCSRKERKEREARIKQIWLGNSHRCLDEGP